MRRGRGPCRAGTGGPHPALLSAYPARVGADPKRLDGLSGDEAFAAVALERVTGGTVRAHDVGRLQGAYDLDLLLPRGRRAAVEVTTYTGRGERPHGSLLGGRLRVARRRRGTAHPVDRGVTATGTSVSVRGPSASLDDLPTAASSLLLVPHVARRAAKVASASEAEERHLFLGLGGDAVPSALRRAMASPGALPPTADPDVEEAELTHFWLTTADPAAPLHCWRRGTGWSVHDAGG